MYCHYEKKDVGEGEEEQNFKLKMGLQLEITDQTYVPVTFTHGKMAAFQTKQKFGGL